MDAYCSRQAINPNSIRFLFDGQRVREDQTPKEVCHRYTNWTNWLTCLSQLGMEDNDVIDAVLQQTVRSSDIIYNIIHDSRILLTRIDLLGRPLTLCLLWIDSYIAVINNKITLILVHCAVS